ncbi:MAG: restriction endonuclease subunit S [Bacteroidaceae bacterium]|nr:restriction endonuclease subunit S [Bacteroidaceae bacterium]
MDIKKHITTLGFVPKNGTNGIYHKIYVDYAIEIDFEKQSINYGSGITADSKTTQNFSDAENFVVLECVDRLLTKGYKPQNIILEKTWPSGHGTSGRLDICVNREDGTPYMLIECKTFGKEYNKELARIRKDGGQLFTYFQLSGGKADVLMLYASELKGNKFFYVNEIIKIEDDYRNGDVKDIYEKWNKLTKDNGIFDSWVQPYNFQSKALTKEQLKEIKAEDSSFIFNRFLEILRHNVVSDKGNAFNKIFTLFLCKVYDETTTDDGEELRFQWLEGRDNHVDFQLRLTDLYSKGMKKFLDRTVSDFNDDDFNKRCASLTAETKEFLRKEVNKLRLEKNNEFAIKEVYDSASFEENAKVVKEVVELIQGYRIRYNKRQQYLSDFFELLLTTGLKQEAGQYFTPVPIAQFIIKSLPLDSIMAEKLSRKDGEILPYMIDYAAGSGHFITEFMHEIQDIINDCDTSKYIEETRKHLVNWQNCHFDWATDYVYGIEKDYRLVKVGKVGCYLHGDGLANVILSDGLANFCNNKEYKGKLRKQTNDGQKDNQQFDIVLSNPPYSVSSFRQTTRDYYTEQDFELYNSLTDNSSEIECLFIERTKQLLKDGGLAGVILPSSILSNSGIYTKAREIILQYFDIVAIAEFGSNTFMATNTNTVVLFLRRRDNYFATNTKNAVNTFFRTLNDVTINGIETPASKYVAHVWEGLDYVDYVTLLQKSPNDKVKAHEIYAEYKKKISAKSEAKLYETILNIEAEKLLYFVLAYPQKVVIIKSGEKDIEKRFLGYEFSNRRGNEGIHAIQKGKNIDECTKLFDANDYDNPEKASTYVYRAFKGDYTSPIAEGMQSHIVRIPLIEMLTFDRDTFEKDLSLAAKKKVNYELAWGNDNLEVLGDIANIQKGTSITKGKTTEGNIPVVAGGKDIAYYHNASNRDGNIITISASGAYAGFVNYFTTPIFASDCNTVKSKDESVISTKLIYVLLRTIQPLIYELQKGQAQPHVYGSDIANIKIPIPPIDVQKQIVEEIGKIEKSNNNAKSLIDKNLSDISIIINGLGSTVSIEEYFDINTLTLNPTSCWKDEFFTYVDIDSVGKGDGCISFDKKILGKDAPSRARRVAEDRTVIVSTVRPNLKGFAYIDSVPEKTIFSTGFALLKSKNEENYISKLLYYLFMFSDNLMKQMETAMPKAAYPSINKEDIDNFKIPLLTIDEQKRIVAQIEALELEITKARTLIESAASEKQAILDKYL